MLDHGPVLVSMHPEHTGGHNDEVTIMLHVHYYVFTQFIKCTYAYMLLLGLNKPFK